MHRFTYNTRTRSNTPHSEKTVQTTPTTPFVTSPLYPDYDKPIHPSFQTVFAKLSHIARLANAIQLQSEIMEQDDVDSSINRLLNNNGTRSIQTLNVTQLKEFRTDFERDINSIETTYETKDAEMVIKTCEKIRFDTIDVSYDFPNRTSFYKSLDDFYANFKPEVVTKAFRPVQFYSTCVGEIEKMSPSCSEKISYIIKNILDLYDHIANLEDFRYFYSVYQRNPVLKNAKKVLELISLRLKLPLVNERMQEIVTLIFSTLSQIKTAMEKNGKDLEFIGNAIPMFSNSSMEGFLAIKLLYTELKEDGKRRKLLKALKPIFDTQSKSKVTFPTSWKALKNIKTLKKIMKTISLEIEQKSIILEYKKCFERGFQFKLSEITEASGIIDQAEKIIESFKEFSKIAEAMKRTSRSDIMKWNDAQSAAKELQKLFNNFNASPLSKNVKNFLVSKGKLDKILDPAKKESNVHNCLKNMAEDSEEASRVVRLGRSLKEWFGRKEFEGLGEYIDQIEVSTKNLESIVEEMRDREANENLTQELSKIDKSLATKIGRAVAGMKNVLEVKNIGLVEDLETYKDTVFKEIDKILVSAGKDELRKKWAAVDDVINRLKSGLSFFSSFTNEIDARNISHMESITDYGTIFIGFDGMPDMKVDESIGEVLDVVVGHNVTLLELRGKVMRVSSLDLEFSKHNLRWVPNVFRKFDEFLNRFLADVPVVPPAKKEKDPAAIQMNFSCPVSSRLLYLALLLIFLAIISLIVFFLLWHYKKLCFKKKWEVCPVIDLDENDPQVVELTEDLIVILVVRQSIGPHSQKYILWAGLMKLVDTEKRDESRPYPYINLSPRKYLDPGIPLIPGNALQSIRIHGNYIKTRLGNEFYACQGPTNASETHDDTRIDLLALIFKDEVECVVMLGSTRLPGGWSLIDGLYFMENERGSMEIGPYTVETVNSEPLVVEGEPGENVTCRKLKITNRKKKVSRELQHFQYATWNDNDIPPGGWETAYRVMRMVTGSKKPIIVHCTKGIGRTMCFIGLEYTSQLLVAHENWSFEEVFKKLIEKRYCSFQNTRQIGWLHVGMVYFITRKYNLDMYMVKEMEKVFKEMIINKTGIPKDGKF
ncbi:hypothetical protein GCK72_015970 [Caenorhabditis remanei]|uniref:Tyrosine-protein phosphatase domain-containing protein n=1 Tax=Caenorhabditis remanei TaxID=31234 RepID=A0A6A5GYN1_CAERE|nr:hypothetical protein GCK72_015970 [Caenorhabditis remanei]KAF1759503.1 hypothetical protein GCK72_015970 [Caenorhabditis remanei]